jgi:hypothetical protein
VWEFMVNEPEEVAGATKWWHDAVGR